MAAKNLEKSLQDMIGQIDEAIVRVRQNILVDISFMDQGVADLCLRVIRSDDAATKALEPKMVELINRLDELAVELKDYQDRIRPEDRV